MTGRERVKRSLNFENPDRVPMSLPPPHPQDMCVAGVAEDSEWKPWRTWESEDCKQWEDEWHNVWKCLPNTTRGEVIEGVIKDWSEVAYFGEFDRPFRSYLTGCFGLI